jgi:hypothetical protein
MRARIVHVDSRLAEVVFGHIRTGKPVKAAVESTSRATFDFGAVS